MHTKILLISLQQTIDVVGLKYVHYSLLEKSYDSTLLFLPYSELDDGQLDVIREFVHELSPQLIGISLMTIDFVRAIKLTAFLKKHFNDIPILWGGYHPTVAPEQCLEYADYVYVGEAERAIVDIAHAVERGECFNNIQGLCFKDKGQIIKNPLYPLNTDLDSFCHHDHIPRNSFILDKRNIAVLDKTMFRKYDRFSGRILYVMSSRGCPLACSYCCNSFFARLYNTKTVRRRSVAHIISEIEKAIAAHPEIEYIDFLDDCFMAAGNEYLNEFCGIYKQKINKSFIIKITPVFVSRDKICSLKEAGLAWVGLGLQSGSDRINEEIFNRKSLSGDFLKAAKICHDLKIAVYYDIIIDNPYETSEDKIVALQVLIRAPKPCLIQIFSLTYYPGSALYERVKKEMPEKITGQNLLIKDHIFYAQDIHNDLIRLAAYMNPRWMRIVVVLYMQNPKSLRFFVMYKVSKLLSVCFFEPLNYFLSIKLSQKGSWVRAFKVLPIYLSSEGMRRYFVSFVTWQKIISYSSGKRKT